MGSVFYRNPLHHYPMVVRGGYQPIGAVIAQGFIHQGIVKAFAAFAHGHSYVGHATATAY